MSVIESSSKKVFNLYNKILDYNGYIRINILHQFLRFIGI